MISIELNQRDRDLLLQLMNESINGIGLHGLEDSRKNEYYSLFYKIKQAADESQVWFHFSLIDLKIIQDIILRAFQWLTFDFSIRLGFSKSEVRRWIEMLNMQLANKKIEFCSLDNLNMHE